MLSPLGPLYKDRIEQGTPCGISLANHTLIIIPIPSTALLTLNKKAWSIGSKATNKSSRRIKNHSLLSTFNGNHQLKPSVPFLSRPKAKPKKVQS